MEKVILSLVEKSKEMTIFTDSSALVALFNPQDPHHSKAKVISKKYKIKSFTISDYIFAETVTVLSQKVGKTEAIYAGGLIKKLCSKVGINEDNLNLAWELFKKQTSKNVSFIDCTTFALYQDGAFDKVFTFDKDFKKNEIPILE